MNPRKTRAQMIKYGVDDSQIKEAESKTEEELKKEEEAKKRRLPRTTPPKPQRPPFFTQL